MWFINKRKYRRVKAKNAELIISLSNLHDQYRRLQSENHDLADKVKAQTLSETESIGAGLGSLRRSARRVPGIIRRL
jgi:hypothetical protein